MKKVLNRENEKFLLKEYYKKNRQFNIFKTLKMDNCSENRHSNFLSWLFNPNETHGLGTKFLEKFILSTLNKDFKPILNNKIKVERELSIMFGNEKKRPDIVIDGDNFTIIIENKFGSDENGNQCEMYRHYFSDECLCENVRYIYLDKNDYVYKKKNISKYGYILATYDKNVLPVLYELTNDKNIELVIKYYIQQYIDLLEDIYAIVNDNKIVKIIEKLNKENGCIKNLREHFYSILENDYIIDKGNKQDEPFSLAIFPKDCYSNNNVPKSKRNNKECMVYYKLFFGTERLYLQILLNKSENDDKYNKICDLLGIKSNNCKDTIIPIEEIWLDYNEYVDLLYEDENTWNIKIKNLLNEKFKKLEDLNNKIRNILLES